MDNEKRLILALVLSFIVLISYQYLFAPPPSKVKAKAPAAQQEQPRQENQQAAPTTTSPAEAQKLASLAALNAQQPQQPALRAETAKEISVTTSLFTAVFSDFEAGLKSFRLHRYLNRVETPAVMKWVRKLISSGSPATAESKPQGMELLPQAGMERLPLRVAFLGSSGEKAEAVMYKSDREVLTLETPKAQGTITLSGKSTGPGSGLSFQKIFSFREDDYRIDADIKITNTSDTAVSGNAIVEWTHSYLAHAGKSSGGFFSGQPSEADTPAKFTYFINGKVVKHEFKDISQQKSPDNKLYWPSYEGEILWTSFEDKYFISAILPQKELPQQLLASKPNENTLSYQLLFPVISLKPGESKTYTCALYLGPKEISILSKQGSKLEKCIDFGWFDIVAKPLLIAMDFFYRFCGNYGIAIILITVIIKILFWPLTHKSYQSMKDMQKLQPEMAKLKEKYKDKKEELNREVMGLYKKYNVNPLGGCLPILLQIPVFIALYNVLQNSIELRHANFISFWINDLSALDPTYISPILMGASMFYQQKMTPSTADPAQAKMMLMMPVIFTFMFLSFPSGLVLYWLVNNVLSIAQQLYINKKSHDSGGGEWAQSKSKPKPLQKQ
jgi:YidC/Oxa1 family membrane protein insertase